jgi:hypothetical protein
MKKVVRRYKAAVFDAVDLVDRGANHDRVTGDGAHIMLFKRDMSEPPPDNAPSGLLARLRAMLADVQDARLPVDKGESMTATTALTTAEHEELGMHFTNLLDRHKRDEAAWEIISARVAAAKRHGLPHDAVEILETELRDVAKVVRAERPHLDASAALDDPAR